MTKPTARDEEKIRGWFHGRIPDDWFLKPPTVDVDREEILVVGKLEEPKDEKGASDAAKSAAREARIHRFREDTRDRRIGIALEAEHMFRKKVSWGAECGDVRRLFTTLSVPAMTRLRMPDRGVLDTLVDAGVARSRSEALAWCVRVVGERLDDWLGDLRKAFEQVEKVRSRGPGVEEA